jgi:hypothetical protein
MPVDVMGRNINASINPAAVMLNKTYSLGVWLQERIRPNRKLRMADLINTAGNRVSPSYDSLVAAIDDFSAAPVATATADISLGTDPCPHPLSLPFNPKRRELRRERTSQSS